MPIAEPPHRQEAWPTRFRPYVIAGQRLEKAASVEQHDQFAVDADAPEDGNC
jgi:hypothetical protein